MKGMVDDENTQLFRNESNILEVKQVSCCAASVYAIFSTVRSSYNMSVV